uniref:Retrotransposon gag domain-containing protein n=2 Tax=Vitis vinifera TaxID=29760 RepID=A5APN3_VITVI|nr:hypothetical protein VITISV_043782 [Vitis vinifera]
MEKDLIKVVFDAFAMDNLKLVFHSWFVDLGNPVETVVHHLLIEGMTCLGRRDGFPMPNEDARKKIIEEINDPAISQVVEFNLRNRKRKGIIAGQRADKLQDNFATCEMDKFNLRNLRKLHLNLRNPPVKDHPEWPILGKRTNGLKRQISNFSVKENEKFYECWERYMEAINACPHHGFDTWLLDELNKGEVRKMKSQPNALNAKAGMYTLNEDSDMKAKVATMIRRLVELELKMIREVPETPMQKIDNLQYSISRLTGLNIVQEKGRFPSQPHQNPKGIHEVEAHKGESSHVRDVKAMITLRSGKEVELPTPKPHDETESEKETEKREEIKGKKKGSSGRKEDHDSTVNEDPEKIVINGDVMKKHMPPPFPQALHRKKGINNALEILEVLRQVKVNIPLLDMIKQVSNYEKFLKDLCIIKRGLNVNKKAFLTKQKIQEQLNESLGDLDEGLPEPSDLLATLLGWRRTKEILPLFNEEEIQEAVKEEAPKLSLKPLPRELKYAYLEENKKCPIVISSFLTTPQEECLLKVLRRCISPLVCTHHIYMEEEAKPVRQPQRRLNPHMQEVVRAEVLKLLQASIIYPISDSPWVSPTQVVQKKSGISNGKSSHYTFSK